MTTSSAYRIVELEILQRRFSRIPGNISDEEAIQRAMKGEGEKTTPYPPEITSAKVIRRNDEDGGHGDA